MKVILIKDLKGKGKKGDIIEISDGYALNYLLPQGIAKAGTSTNLNEAQQAKKAQEYHDEQNKLEAQKLKDAIEKCNLVIKVKTGATGKTFGSVTNKEVCEELAKQNIIIDKKKIDAINIKAIGVFSVKVKLHPQVTANLKFEIQSI